MTSRVHRDRLSEARRQVLAKRCRTHSYCSVAEHVGCTNNTIRRALAGDVLNGGSLQKIVQYLNRDAYLFLDTEFNGFGGELISMALVPVEGEPFYEVLTVPLRPVEFVADNILPKLERAPIGLHAFTSKLDAFLTQYPRAVVVADWPADLVHLANALTDIGAASNFTRTVEVDMKLVSSPPLEPVTRHNALSDATALRDWYVRERLGGQES